MSKRLKKHIELYAEYGEFNHEMLALCYENILNKDACHRFGMMIAKRGGLQALQANFYAFKCFGAFAESSNSVIRSVGSLLEQHWNGIESDGQIWRP
jgi:hypothetical protein